MSGVVPRELAVNIVIPIIGQAFYSHHEWVNLASVVLTAHPDYWDSEHRQAGEDGYIRNHFKAMCYDQKGRRCLKGEDFRIAAEESAFPVWWVWPDQIADLLMARSPRLDKAEFSRP
jgi:hypothetical protein